VIFLRLGVPIARKMKGMGSWVAAMQVPESEGGEEKAEEHSIKNF
jgi:hypothetical protein